MAKAGDWRRLMGTHNGCGGCEAVGREQLRRSRLPVSEGQQWRRRDGRWHLAVRQRADPRSPPRAGTRPGRPPGSNARVHTAGHRAGGSPGDCSRRRRRLPTMRSTSR